MEEMKREEIWETAINRIGDELVNVKIVHCNSTKGCWSICEHKALRINCYNSSNKNRDTCSDSHTLERTLEAFTVNRIFPTFEWYSFLVLSLYLQLGFSYSSVFSFFFILSVPSACLSPCASPTLSPAAPCSLLPPLLPPSSSPLFSFHPPLFSLSLSPRLLCPLQIKSWFLLIKTLNQAPN